MEIAGGRRRREDRVSKLGTGALGRILSFLPAKEAARAAALSSSWRHAYGGVDAVSLEEPENPDPDYENDEDIPSGFANAVTAALFARNRRPDAPPPPLRALRVALYYYTKEDASAVDHWVSYALSHAASPPAGLELVLRFDREPLCSRPYGLRVRRSEEDKVGFGSFDGPSPDAEHAPRSASGSVPSGAVEEHAEAQPSRKRGRSTSSSSSSSDESESEEEEVRHRTMPRPQTSPSESSSSDSDDSDSSDYQRQPSPSRNRNQSPSSSDSDDSDSEAESDDPDSEAESSSDGHEDRSPSPPPGEDDDVVSVEADPTQPRSPCAQSPKDYTVPGRLFSCAALRSLGIGPCRLSPPAVISLPSLEELFLVRVSDAVGDVQRLIAACPRLADLTLEACATVTQLSVLGNRRLRRLALRCCHRLANVAVDDRLQSFEYRGTVPETSLLTIQGEAGGGGSRFMSCKVDICGEELSSEEELTKLREFLQQLASTKHLHLQSPRLGAGVDHEALVSFPAFMRLLHLELTGQLPHEDHGVAAVAAVSRILRHAPSLEVITLVFHTARGSGYRNEHEALDAHELRYNEHEVLAAPAVIIPCLRNRVREINLVHYQGGRAQRTLAKFLLCNAPVLDKLYCGLASGPLWIQTKLKDEMQGWAMNKPGNRIFS